MISAVVLTLNEERHLADCLASVRWADETVVLDSFSTDRTADIAAASGARLVRRAFADYADQRNAALDAARAEGVDWVLFVDADERATPALAGEVRAATQAHETAGWWVPRHNYIFGKLTLHAGWYPDYQMRLLRPDRARFDPARPVHELAQLDGPEGFLQNPLIHLNYDTVAEFTGRQHRYARYDAGILLAQGRRARVHNFVLQPLRHFLWRYVTLAGWRDGWHGLRLSGLMAYFQIVLYWRLWGLNQAAADRKRELR